MIKKIILLLLSFIVVNLIIIACNIYILGLFNFNLDIVNFLRYNFNFVQLLSFTNIIFYLITFILFLIICNFTQKNYYKFILVFFSIILLLGTIKFCVSYKVFYYLINKVETGDFYEKHYVDAKKVSIQAPETKKNLILIFMESMEFTFANKKIFNENLIPELIQLSDKNISFNKHLQGYFQDNTQMSLVATMTGLPCRAIFINGILRTNRIGIGLKKFLPNVYSLPEILKDNGYTTTFIQGGNIYFAGTKTFLQQHGFDSIYGKEELRKEFNNAPETTPWGVEDKLTLDFLKKEILNRSKTNVPFFFTIFTINTHAYEPASVYEDINDIKKASKLMDDFINWCNKQSFIKDTTIIIVGDHLRMKDNLDQFLDKNYDKRYIYNTFINSVYSDNKINRDRTFSQVDLFPTILEAIGFKVEGSKLGLGTSLFSDKKTLLEEFGEKELNSQLEKNNKLYKNLWKNK